MLIKNLQDDLIKYLHHELLNLQRKQYYQVYIRDFCANLQMRMSWTKISIKNFCKNNTNWIPSPKSLNKNCYTRHLIKQREIL